MSPPSAGKERCDCGPCHPKPTTVGTDLLDAVHTDPELFVVFGLLDVLGERDPLVNEREKLCSGFWVARTLRQLPAFFGLLSAAFRSVVHLGR